MFEKKQFYLNTPEGDLLLTEVFRDKKSVTILIGGQYRIDLDVDSALDLADSLLILTSEEGEKDAYH